jgi:hypothetical protein
MNSTPVAGPLPINTGLAEVNLDTGHDTHKQPLRLCW